jgi:hypothetical protein
MLFRNAHSFINPVVLDVPFHTPQGLLKKKKKKERTEEREKKESNKDLLVEE